MDVDDRIFYNAERIAFSLDENGEQVIHISNHRPLKKKCKNQPLSIVTVFCAKISPFPDRCLSTRKYYSPFVMRDVNSISAMLHSKGNIKGWAYNNTYEENF